MASQFPERVVKFINKDFLGFKRDLIKFTQAHQSGSFQDFNETSPGMAILEMQAFIADNLSYYLDQQFLELKQESSRQIENVAAFAEAKGYKPKGKAAARGIQSFIIEIPAVAQGGVLIPDPDYSPTLKTARLEGPNGTVFEITDQINFSTSSLDNPRYVTGSSFDATTGAPTHFAVRKDVEIIAGETKTDTFVVGDFQPHLEIELTNEDVLEIISVTDSDGNSWYEVDYLARDTVFEATTNTGEDSDIVPFVLKVVPAPRRFITKRDVTTEKTKLIFGSGDGVNFDDELVPNLADLALPIAGRTIFTSYALDPQNFLKTRSLGLSPYNTTLTVIYRVGGGAETNVPAGSISNIVDSVLEFSRTDLDANKKSRVIASLESINASRTKDGGPVESISEIKINSDAYFAAQDRCITKEDYIVRVLSLPAKFGKPFKVYAKPTDSRINAGSIDIHILTKDIDNHLDQASQTLLNNIKTYLSVYSGLSEGVNILKTNIINLKLEFGIVVSPKFNRNVVLTKCLAAARDYLHVDKIEIAQPISISHLMAELQKIEGVISVYKLQFKNLFCSQQQENNYSTVRFDIRAHTSNNILFPHSNSIFEIKFPYRDIVGEAK